MPTVTLFAWVSPAFTPNSPVDHTFVTDYDSRKLVHPDIDTVKNGLNHFWYCWGAFRAKGKSKKLAHGFVISGDGSLAEARCICEPNLRSKTYPSAQGTIADYGFDGVCHQLGNQILWATRGAGKPKTFVGVRGYWASAAMYGSYGRDEGAWERKKSSCAPESEGSVPGAESMFDDEFFAHAAAVLSEKGVSQAIEPLQTLRVALGNDLSLLKESGASMSALENRLTTFFEQCAAELGEDAFFGVFEFPSEQSRLVVQGLLEHETDEHPEDQRQQTFHEM